MKFKDFFNYDSDRDVAEALKHASHISMHDSDRDRMRAHLSEYTKMRPIRAAQSAHTRTHYQLPSFLVSVRSMPLIAALLIVSIGGSAVRAESALPGDLLYPIKVHFIEEVQASLTRSPDAKAQWAVARAERRLEEAVALELSGDLTELASAQLDTNLEEHVRFAHESTQTPEIAANVGAIEVARENILGAAKSSMAIGATPAPIARAKATPEDSTTTLRAEAPQAAMMMAQDASPATGITQESATLAADATAFTEADTHIEQSEIRARGNRTAAKVRIEAAKRFLESNKKIDEEVRKEAQERLKVALETISSGDDKSSRGEQADAASEFEQALEAATEAGTLLSSKKRGEH